VYSGKMNTGWLDGHARSNSLYPIDFDDVLDASSPNYDRATLTRYGAGILAPPGMVAQSGSKVQGVSILNDPRVDNYLTMKKVP
jgi:prepilin-type processing-associated H-X9-DG protein